MSTFSQIYGRKIRKSQKKDVQHARIEVLGKKIKQSAATAKEEVEYRWLLREVTEKFTARLGKFVERKKKWDRKLAEQEARLKVIRDRKHATP